MKIGKMTRAIGNPRGFTLLEVLMAMVVATIGILGLATMQGSAIQANSFSSHFTQASQLAQRSIESLNSEYLDPSDVMDNALKIGATLEEAGIDESGADGGIFTRTWTVQAYSTFSRWVTVTVSWNDHTGKERQIQMSTITRGRQN